MKHAYCTMDGSLMWREKANRPNFCPGMDKVVDNRKTSIDTRRHAIFVAVTGELFLLSGSIRTRSYRPICLFLSKVNIPELLLMLIHVMIVFNDVHADQLKMALVVNHRLPVLGHHRLPAFH